MGSQRAILLLLIAIQVYYESVLAKSVHHSDDTLRSVMTNVFADDDEAYLARRHSSVPSKNLKVRQTLGDHSAVGHVGTNAAIKKSAVRQVFNPLVPPFPKEPFRRSFINRPPDYIKSNNNKKIQLGDDYAAKDNSEEGFIIRVPKRPPSNDFDDDYIIRVPKRPPSDDFEDDAQAARDDFEDDYIIRGRGK